MARKTFISYKHSEAQDTRDLIIKALGEDATYYQGETAESPDISDTKTENIRRYLKDMIYDTSVTIVVISPNIKKSKWIDWEIEYSLKEITRDNRTSKTNGIIGVIMKIDGGYDWLIRKNTYVDGCTSRTVDNGKLYDIINRNRFNLKNNEYVCDHCKTYDVLKGSYISIIDQDSFIREPFKYIENAYDKSKIIDQFDLQKIR